MLIEDDVAKQWDKRGGGKESGERERERERECVLSQREKKERGERRSGRRGGGRGEGERERERERMCVDSERENRNGR